METNVNYKNFDSAKAAATDFSNITPLDQQKAAAKAEIDEKAQALIDEVNADSSLTPAQKQAKIAAIEKAAAEAKADIDKAQSADEIKTALNLAEDKTVEAMKNTNVPAPTLPETGDSETPVLPNTGERDSESAFEIAMLLIMLTGFSLAVTKQRKNDQVIICRKCTICNNKKDQIQILYLVLFLYFFS